MTKYLLVGGRFDDQGGKPSGYVKKLFTSLQRELPGDWEIHNGGEWNTLEAGMQEKIKAADVVLWFPDVPNDKHKVVRDLKQINPKMMLVTSKNNIEEQGRNYNRLELVARALQSKANLLIELNKKDGQFVATIIDPLGNEFAFQEPVIEKVARAVAGRLSELKSYTRVPSYSIGEAKPVAEGAGLDGFFGLVRDYAERFHSLTHAVHQDRLIGNVSFRCERGFPSFRQKEEGKNIIYVSRRNIDKRHIGREGFVAVNGDKTDAVEYFGDIKPSVDTPVQLGLYQQYPNVNYMLHSHTYIKGAPFTDGMTPCGAIEEIDEIKKLYPDSNAKDFYINLKGHGSLALVSDWEKLRDIPYVARSVYDDPMRNEIFEQYQAPKFSEMAKPSGRTGHTL